MSDPRAELLEALSPGATNRQDEAALTAEALEAATEDLWDALKADDKRRFRSALDDIVDIKLAQRG